jgi:hypothetical protein
MLADYRHWLKHDSGARKMLLILMLLAVLLMGIGVVTLIECSSC